MVGCPVSGRVVLLVNECNWYPFSIVQFLSTNYIVSSSLTTFIISLLLFHCEHCIAFLLWLQKYTVFRLKKIVTT